MNTVTGLTPLGEAVWYGKVDKIKQLLKEHVDVNGGSRPPLWVAASRPINHAGRIIDMLLEAGADPNKASTIDSNSTPLLGAVKLSQPPDIIRALVDHGADPTIADENGDTARGVADKKKDLETLKALQPRNDRALNRPKAVLVLTGLLLFVVAWANKNIKATTAAIVAGTFIAREAIKKRFNMSGIFDKIIPEKYQKRKDAEIFEKDMRDFILEKDLNRFFPPDDPFLQEVVERAVNLRADPDNSLDVHDLARLALYQPVLYCDDSGSMNDHQRKDHQNELVKRITSITTRIVPDSEGIEVRFINQPTEHRMSKPDAATIDNIMSELKYNGWTEIGLNLKQKVLEPLVYRPLQDNTFKRPLLISVTTDGHPQGPSATKETYDTFKNAILECGQKLEKYGYERKVVRFQVSQIGSDDRAREFLESLDGDSELSDVLYRTSELLDEEFVNLRDNERKLEQWLLRLLMSPILDADSG